MRMPTTKTTGKTVAPTYNSNYSEFSEAEEASSVDGDQNTDLREQKRRADRRFQNTWESILAKYSNLEDEGDVVDLETGEIIEDRGHLRSLESRDSVWSEGVETMHRRKRGPYQKRTQQKSAQNDKSTPQKNSFMQTKGAVETPPPKEVVLEEDAFDNLLTPSSAQSTTKALSQGRSISPRRSPSPLSSRKRASQTAVASSLSASPTRKQLSSPPKLNTKTLNYVDFRETFRICAVSRDESNIIGDRPQEPEQDLDLDQGQYDAGLEYEEDYEDQSEHDQDYSYQDQDQHEGYQKLHESAYESEDDDLEDSDDLVEIDEEQFHKSTQSITSKLSRHVRLDRRPASIGNSFQSGNPFEYADQVVRQRLEYEKSFHSPGSPEYPELELDSPSIEPGPSPTTIASPPSIETPPIESVSTGYEICGENGFRCNRPFCFTCS